MRTYSNRARYLAIGTSALLATAFIAACGSSGSGSSTSSSPILVGASLSLTGSFSTDGQAFEKGYNLWVKDINAAGGLLGRKVKLIVLNDASSQTQTVTNDTTLISVDHVNLLFGPFSSLLTLSAAPVAHRFGKALD